MNKEIYISNGNIKVNAVIFNLPCGITCKPGLKCNKYCYAKKAEYLYPQVLPCRTNNLKRSKRADFIFNMVDKLSNKKRNYIRIHESGDFYSKRYILDWFTICNILSDKTFYAYTKRDDLFNAKILSYKPNNLTLIRSLDGIYNDITNINIPIGYDKVALTSEKYNNCTTIDNNNIKCMTHCFKCLKLHKEKVIIFKKH